jgi:hypothetical protein
MIVVVEGASAAGKTAWCRSHARRLTVWEPASRLQAHASSLGPDAARRFWSEIQTRRWDTARRIEARVGTAFCDTDPFKLHYSWCRWQAGIARKSEFDGACVVARRGFGSGELGLADLVMFADLDESELRRRKSADKSRSRRGFEEHLLLREPLRRWYSAMDRLEPGHVIWSLPREGLPGLPRRTRAVRTGAELYDRFVTLL